ncbi:MAG: flagellar basal-body MS-ring/collar protein FliF [Polyangiaceae bacterium]
MSDPKKSPTTALLPPQVAAVIARAKAFFSSLSKGARILLFSTATLAAIFVGYLVFHATNENYAVLFSQLDRDDASGVVAKLKEMKVPYKLSQDGATIEVPEAKALDLRLELATSGLPRGGGVGFESFDKMRLGATEFEQRVLYRRALEGELGRTIGTISGVESTRVHLVMPEKSVFVSRTEPASASIVVKLKPGHTIDPQEVGGIIHLTASAVPGLSSDQVTLVTTDGQMLHRPRKPGADGESDDSGEASSSHALETSLSDRAREMIEKIVGPGHVDVQVSADVDTARVEHIEDHYNPAVSVIRSEEATVERSSGAIDDTVAGVPGAESNVPSGSSVGAANVPKTPPVASAAAPKPASSAATPAASASAALAAISPLSLPSPALSANVERGLPQGTMRESHTRNFEIDHVSDKRTLAPGAVRRLAVAVVVDGVEVMVDGRNKSVPRDREQLDKIAALVRGAVGIDEKRGDILTVESVPFLSDKVEEPIAPTASKSPITLEDIKALKAHPRIVGGVAATMLLLGLMAGVVVKRRRSRTKAAAAAAAAEERSKILSFGSAPVISQIEANRLTPEAARLAAHERAKEDPATAALVLKAWLGVSENEDKLAQASAS